MTVTGNRRMQTKGATLGVSLLELKRRVGRSLTGLVTLAIATAENLVSCNLPGSYLIQPSQTLNPSPMSSWQPFTYRVLATQRLYAASRTHYRPNFRNAVLSVLFNPSQVQPPPSPPLSTTGLPPRSPRAAALKPSTPAPTPRRRRAPVHSRVNEGQETTRRRQRWCGCPTTVASTPRL